ncbi:vacuolar protein sorting-associated protein VTA1 homolog isoform X3 [Anarhichas minor]|uniref:vacuolar protein sorting-associated protein VTA1 homolog isoform X3 n=1 Tax=Anarhichas minor TaxID=65739 RepID=UPI003F737475
MLFRLHGAHGAADGDVMKHLFLPLLHNDLLVLHVTREASVALCQQHFHSAVTSSLLDMSPLSLDVTEGEFMGCDIFILRKRHQQNASCRLYAMQAGMKLDSKTPECRKFLVKLMDQLETMKKELGDNDSISQEVVGNAHIENYALKMFLYADNEDRQGRFHKNMIKSFYSASLLLDVLSVFGELSEENIQHRKYARWKATYIHNCLKNGETPQAGPIGMDEDEEAATAYRPLRTLDDAVLLRSCSLPTNVTLTVGLGLHMAAGRLHDRPEEHKLCTAQRTLSQVAFGSTSGR